jgi:hypothetical protein
MRKKRHLLTGNILTSSLRTWWSRPLVIKSVQRGTITITGATSNTATITAVDVANARLRFLNSTQSANDTDAQSRARIALTNSTTVTATVNTSPGADSVVVSFEVTEYYVGVLKRVQRGTVIGGTTATITAVVPGKTELDYLGATSTNIGPGTSTYVRIDLTNSTTVTATAVAGAETAGYQVVEFN